MPQIKHAHILETIVNPQQIQKELEWISTKQYKQSNDYLGIFRALEALKDPEQDQEQALSRRFQNYTNALFQNFKVLLTKYMNNFGEVRLQLSQFQRDLLQTQQKNQTLQETVDSLEKKNQEWQHQYDLLKQQQIEMQERYEMNQLELHREKKQIKQTFRIVQESAEQERLLIQNLHLQKLEISTQIQEEKKQKKQLLQKLDTFRAKMVESDLQLAQSARKINIQQKQIQRLSDELKQKEQIIQRLMRELYPEQQIEVIELQKVKGNIQQQKNQEQQQVVRYSFVNKVKLDQDFMTMPLQPEPDEMQRQMSRKDSLIQSFRQQAFMKASEKQNEIVTEEQIVIAMAPKKSLRIPQSMVKLKFKNSNSFATSNIKPIKDQTFPTQQQQQLVKISNPILTNIPDFYFAHYILTVQSIKMQLNRDQYFEKDMKPFYDQIITSLVPMHRWSQWITNKLQKS